MAKELAERGVQTVIHYRFIRKKLAPTSRRGRLRSSHTEEACRQILSLPIFPAMTVEQVDYVVVSLREILES